MNYFNQTDRPDRFHNGSISDHPGCFSNGALRRVTIDLFPARGHLARFINELFPSADTTSFEGTLVVEVEGGLVAAVALELGTQPGEFTTLPVTAIR